ncbi:bifunctional demethylmenaquinone methyltransferase/2-methoxy-6-polyprenyl-1,4-benzoquinol methylase [bacterium K02(2017)]|nr:bifunctional demethylmenaquinone methyltransferase/2-methoxy-6-polyprenyl-1,4-benzoquinol methylase [bacterium K02(2017)]
MSRSLQNSIKSQSVQNIFDQISPTYDRLNHLMSLNFDKSWRKKTIGLIKKTSETPFTAIDLCAGTFDLSLECLKQFPQSKIMAVDFSQEMLNAGQPKIAEALIDEKIKPICADCLSLPFAANSIDVIFCGFGFRNFVSVKKGIMEAKRVLKPGGQLIVLEFFKPKSGLNQFFHTTYAKHVIPIMGKMVSGHDIAYDYLKDSIKDFLSAREFKSILQSYDFHHTEIKDFFMSISTAISTFKRN